MATIDRSASRLAPSLRSDQCRELEARLAVHWDRDTLAAYGDALRGLGDPRGELIAADLAGRARDPELERTWLGDLADVVATRYGFIEARFTDAHETELEELLAGPAACYLRRLTLLRDDVFVERAIAMLVGAERPLLETLVIELEGERSQIIVDDDTAAALVRATPNLHELVVRGHRVIGAFVHSAVRMLRVDGFDAIGPLAGAGALPGVVELDLAIQAELAQDAPDPAALLALAPRRAFPALTSLDFSRNEPADVQMAPRYLGGDAPVFDVLGRLEIVDQLEHLRVPSVREAGQAIALQAAIARMPRLRSLAIACRYAGDATLEVEHATAAIELGPLVPWPPLDTIQFDSALSIIELDTHLPLQLAGELMEVAYREMPAAAQTAWRTIWEIAADTEHRHSVAPSVIRDALAPDLAIAEARFRALVELRARVAGGDHQELHLVRVENYVWQSPDMPADEPYERAQDARITELEAQLQRAWDPELAAVYADELQRHGDARGDLLAVDLRDDAGELTGELETQRYVASRRWLGGHWQHRVRPRHALLDMALDDYDQSLALLESPLADYLRVLRFGRDAIPVARVLDRLAERANPWLARIAFESITDHDHRLLDGERWAAFARAAPNLAQTDLVHTLDAIAYLHPTAPRLVVTGATTLCAIAATPRPQIRELDFAFADATWPDSHPALAQMLAAFPQLHRLDLARNEPRGASFRTGARHQAGALRVFEALAAIDTSTLRELRLPSLRGPADVAHVQALLDRSPDLERLEVARMYASEPQGEQVVPHALHHATAELVIPAPVTWPPGDRVPPDQTMQLDVPDGGTPAAVFVHELIAVMEGGYTMLGEPARAAWDALWTELRGAVSELPAALVFRALDTLDAVFARATRAHLDAFAGLYNTTLAALRDRLRPLVVSDTVIPIRMTQS